MWLESALLYITLKRSYAYEQVSMKMMMDKMAPGTEVYACRFATRNEIVSPNTSNALMKFDIDAPVPMDFFVYFLWGTLNGWFSICSELVNRSCFYRWKYIFKTDKIQI